MTNHGKTVETLSGTVEQLNAKQTGIKLLGELLNVSQYHPIVPMPTSGDFVEVQLERSDRGPWVNSLRVIGAASTPTSSTSTNRDHAIAKMSALRSAAIYCGHRSTVVEGAKSTDVLKVAEAWLAWLEAAEA